MRLSMKRFYCAKRANDPYPEMLRVEEHHRHSRLLAGYGR